MSDDDDEEDGSESRSNFSSSRNHVVAAAKRSKNQKKESSTGAKSNAQLPDGFSSELLPPADRDIRNLGNVSSATLIKRRPRIVPANIPSDIEEEEGEDEGGPDVRMDPVSRNAIEVPRPCVTKTVEDRRDRQVAPAKTSAPTSKKRQRGNGEDAVPIENARPASRKRRKVVAPPDDDDSSDDAQIYLAKKAPSKPRKRKPVPVPGQVCTVGGEEKEKP